MSVARHRKWIALSVIGVIIIIVVGCGKTRCPDPTNEEEVDAIEGEAFARMQKQAAKDPSFCRELTTPRIEVVGPAVVMTGGMALHPHDVASRADLSADQVRFVKPLSDRLRGHRVLWKKLHPSSAFPSNAEVVLDPALETSRAASVVLTAAYAGFFENQRVTAGDIKDVTVEWWIPHPPDTSYIETILHVERAPPIDDARWTLQLNGPVCRKSARIDTTNNVTALASDIGRLCTGITRCVDAIVFRVPPKTPFREVLSMIRSVRESLPPAKREPDLDKPISRVPEVALLVTGSEPLGFGGSPRGWTPGPEASGNCLPDGGDN